MSQNRPNPANAPNLLGKALNYVSSAVSFAFPQNSPDQSFGPAIKARPHAVSGMFDNILTDMTKGAVPGNTYTEQVNEGRMVKLALTSTWLHSDINLIANRVSRRDARPMVVKYVSGQRKPNVLYEHPFNSLLARPNPLMSGSDLLRRTTWWLELTGNAYWFIGVLGFGKGEPVELWPLPATQITPLPATKHAGAGVWAGREIIDYSFNINGKNTILRGESIIPFQDPNPLDTWIGMSKLSGLKVALETDEAQRNFLRTFYKDGVRPASIISLPRETEQSDFDEIRKQIIAQYRGGGKDAIIRAGDFTIESAQATLDSLGFDTTRTMTKEEIDRMYFVPTGYAEGTGDSSAAIFFANNAVQPRLDMMAETITLNLAPYYGDDFLLEAADVVPQERALDVQEYNIFTQDLTTNEARDKQGISVLPPLMVSIDGKEIDLLNDVPVRLQGSIISMALSSMQADEAEEAAGKTEPGEDTASTPVNRSNAQANQEKRSPKTGDMVATSHFERDVNRQATKAGGEPELQLQAQTQVVDFSPAEIEGIKSELGKWKKIARKEVEAGRKPWEREFTSEIIPAATKTSVLSMMQTEHSLDIVFDLNLCNLVKENALP